MLFPIVSALFLCAPTIFALCPPPGPILAPPYLAPGCSNFTIPDSAFSNFSFLADTSFSIKASIGNATVFEYEHSASGREVDQSLLKTKFRIASATKMITALALLLSKDKLSLEDPITKFIPGLKEEFYGDVTIGSLTDHTSGLGRFGYTTDLAVTGQQTSALGLPQVENTLPGCDPFPGGRECAPQEILDEFNDAAYAPHSPYASASYSNIGYILLGKALEAVHNQTYEEVIQKLILDPVGMTESTFTPPTDNMTAILPRRIDDVGWFVANFGNLNPAGGLWSTTNDMLKLLQALQSNKLLSSVELRKWLQPTTFLTSIQQYVGVSWEIIRSTDMLLDFPRPIDIYTKAGGVPGYASYAVLIPEYNMSIAINAAGGEPAYPNIALLATTSKALVPYADQLARSQAAEKYAGTYTLHHGNSTDTITISSNSGPGLSIHSLTVNDVPVLRALAASQGTSFDNFSARLYPTDPDSLGTSAENWRMLLDQKVAEKLWADMECMSWNLGDRYRYVKQPLDTFVFHIEDGKVISVELLGWRVTLRKVA